MAAQDATADVKAKNVVAVPAEPFAVASVDSVTGVLVGAGDSIRTPLSTTQ